MTMQHFHDQIETGPRAEGDVMRNGGLFVAAAQQVAQPANDDRQMQVSALTLGVRRVKAAASHYRR